MESKKLTDIYLSSDSEQILNIAKPFKKIFIHKREANLATDESPVIDTVVSLLETAQYRRDHPYDLIALLQPTAPLRTGEDIDKAIGLLATERFNSVISVCESSDVHPARMYQIKDGGLKTFMPDFEETNRQQLPPVYFRNGCIYVSRANAILEHHSIMAKPICPYVMPYRDLLNIDEPRDLIIAEPLISNWLKSKE